MKFKVDIDDTLITTEIDKNGNYRLTGIKTEVINKINKLYSEGHTIIVETGRHWNHLHITLEQLKDIELKYHTLIMGKPPVDYDIDDKNIRPDEIESIIA